MLTYRLGTLTLIVGLALSSACGGDDDGHSSAALGGGVGAACTASSQCTGYAKAACVTDIRPLEHLVTSDDPKYKPFRDLSLPFPGGYCSSTVEDPCTSDADCGSGQCFLAFEGVSQQTIDGLNSLGLPFDVNAFAKIGICLKPCTADSQCRADKNYKCIVPLTALVKVFNPDYPKKFCVQDVDYSNLLVSGGT